MCETVCVCICVCVGIILLFWNNFLVTGQSFPFIWGLVFLRIVFQKDI